MRITILTVPDCPNAPVVRERITAALDGRSAEVELVDVREDDEAARWGMTGSPTVLLDGVDPFAVPGAPTSVSCRLYRDADGRADGAPSVQSLRQALSGTTPAPATEGLDCCEADLLDPIGRAGRGRRAPAERGLRAVHQAVLRHFATLLHRDRSLFPSCSRARLGPRPLPRYRTRPVNLREHVLAAGRKKAVTVHLAQGLQGRGALPIHVPAHPARGTPSKARGRRCHQPDMADRAMARRRGRAGQVLVRDVFVRAHAQRLRCPGVLTCPERRWCLS
ncbi:hypothetical protein [Streptomyces atratus]|uniref:hypothetical protein n=1 Tax=Streptomyces atratus TaxID=1893 RepID=UPI0022550E87|nr:hypothetical protein [Streptomyces atratus]MCX5338523.1 hypothetical protein [Streptomyces atratus]